MSEIIYSKDDLWHYLQRSKKTVVMYGMGNGADKILKVCERYGIEVADFFASDGFVRGHKFHEKTVLSYSQMKAKYGQENVIVLLSFGSSLPDVIELIKGVSRECELYAPDVPVCGDNLFNKEFLETNLEDIAKARELFADERSKEIYDGVIKYKLTGNIAHLFSAESAASEQYALLGAESFKSYADLGAYNGDTVREMLTLCPELSRIYAFEPDAKNHKKLCAYCETLSEGVKVTAINAAAWSENAALNFSAEGNRNSRVFAAGKKVKEIEGRTLDSVLNGDGVDYIKYDVEGAELEALKGSAETINKYLPNMLVSLYHRSEDIFKLPLYIYENFPGYRLYLRRLPYIPAWDLNLLCVKEN